MKALLIAEKPSLANEIRNTYNKMSSFSDTIEITNFVGHIVGLKNPKEYGIYKGKDWTKKKWDWDMLPMIPDIFEYKATETKIYSNLKSKVDLGSYDYIINACDPDREGNHIFQLFYDLSGCKLPIKRFWTNDLTEKSIQHALENLRYDGDGKSPNLKCLTEAAKLRAKFDWLCGMNFTIAGSLQMHQTAKIGRVKTPTLTILAKREEELANFVPKTTYELESIYQEGFTGILFDKEGNIRFEKKEDSESILSKLGKTAIVESVEKKTEATNAPQLYKLSDLQVDGSKMFGYGADKVLEIAQSLYEKKLLSYPRTDCRCIGTELTKDFKKILDVISTDSTLKPFVDKITSSDADKVKKNKKYVNDAELKKSGHYALVPTLNKPAFSHLPTDETNILLLVYKRFLALFLPPLVMDKTTIITNNNDFNFRTTGKTLVSKGYTEIYGSSFTDVELPKINKADIVNVKEFNLAEKITTPPSRYTEGTLIAAMENPGKFLNDDTLKDIIKESKGIGTPATRAGIIKQLFSDNYISTKKGKGKAQTLFVEPAGMNIYHNIKTKDFASVDMTGIWESKLKDVELGDLSTADFEKEMKQYVLKSLKDIQDTKMISGGFSSSAKSIGVCPKCKKPVLVGKSYYLCQGYKTDCDFIIGMNILGAKITETEAKKLLDGKETKELSFKKGDKSWKNKLIIEDGKVNFVKKSSGNTSEKKEIGKCPICGGIITMNDYGLFCEKEDFKFFRKLKGTVLSDDDLIALYSGETITKQFQWASGKSSEAKCHLENGVPKFEF